MMTQGNPINFIEIQQKILTYIESESESEQEFKDIIKVFSDYQITDEKINFEFILNLIKCIANNHHRSPNFFDQIFKFLDYFQEDIKKHFSNNEIYNIFKSNKRVLLFLIEDKILPITKEIAYKIINENNQIYFFPEVEKFVNKCNVQKFKEKMGNNFIENRKNGENDNYICRLIQNDSIVDFIKYIEQSNISLNSTIKPSIFETNSFLLNKTPTLIEYSAFYGSFQIFNYLFKNKVVLNQSVCLYAIHGANPEIFDLIEENYFDLKDKSDISTRVMQEAVICHHLQFAEYIEINIFSNLNESITIERNKKINSSAIKSLNFKYIKKEFTKIDDYNEISHGDFYDFALFLIGNDLANVNSELKNTYGIIS